jgi:acetyltransferase
MADPDHDEAEFAVIVNDAWQHKGLGSKLTDVCLEIAAAWGVRRLTADTEPTNNRMLAIFRRHGFQLSHVDDVIKAQKELGPTDSPDDRQQAPAYSGA